MNVLLVTLTLSIAPILQDHCVQCHHAGGMAPFSVETFEQARPWAKSIARAVANKDMPPFHADGPIGKWVDDPRLTDAEIETVIAWTNAPERYESLAYTRPVPSLPSGEALWVSMQVDGGGVDSSKVNIIRNPIVRPVKVSAFLWTQTGPPIHHASIQRKDDGMRNVIPLSQYLPNGGGARVPDGYAVTIHPTNDLRAPIHVGPTNEPGTLTATVYLEAAQLDALELPEPFTLSVEHVGEIPPQGGYTQTIQRVAECDMLIRAYTVHMHAIGESARLYVDGDEVFAVPRYDENWQRTYVLAEPLSIGAGSLLKAELNWNNEGSEPVGYGPLSTEEMGWIELIWTPTG